jgi:hypothetical protein
MARLNKTYLETSSAVTVLVVINFTLSGIYFFSQGSFALTTLLSYLVLVMLKLVTTRTNAQASVKSERAFSAYMTVHKTFNVIDPDYRAELDEVPLPNTT